jgi:2-keto-3-deoxy-L-rhamnonate aldolase RhmA
MSHPRVVEAQQAILDACCRQNVAAGIHVVAVDPAEVQRRIQQGFRFIACGIDTQFIIHGCRTMWSNNA